ncbi:MAG: hypothetical protein NUV74_15205 [Candidatus Brocadiaceae bacterium]|nr:hypothetical protein [Candidatus Brocadiaceae bacterium]
MAKKETGVPIYADQEIVGVKIPINKAFLRVLQSKCPRLYVGIIMDEQFIRNTFALQLTKYCASFVENCF